MEIYVRPESHEIDTLARRKVPLAFPAAWEHRELTGRDYGIDMIIEVFRDGVATGNSLSLQIKGTSKDIRDVNRVMYDVPVNTLKYSEMFIAPVLLVVCPVEDGQNGFYYLWLQEYIKVVLDHDNPNWRQNTSTARVYIPKNNYMPGDENKLAFIAGFPKRIFEWCQFARICEDLRYDLNSYFETDDMVSDDFIDIKDYEDVKMQAKDDLMQVIKKINEIIQLESIFNEKDWKAPKHVLNDTILPALAVANDLYNDSVEDKRNARIILANLSSISSLLGIYNDYSFSRVLWEKDGQHNF